MHVKDVLISCIFCPGLCTYRCPVYKSSYHRMAEPVNIARGLYRYLTFGDKGMLRYLGYCSLCGSCGEICPIGNPLPKAIETLRNNLSNEVHEKQIDFRGIGIYTLKEALYDYDILRKIFGVDVSLIDTKDRYLNVVFGYKEREAPNGYSEDVDVHIGPYTIDMLVDMDQTIDIGEYILHIPCKIGDEDLSEKFMKVFGKPMEIFNICLGGGGIDILAPELIKKLTSRFNNLRYPLLTQCARGARILRMRGVNAYTPLEAISRWMK